MKRILEIVFSVILLLFSLNLFIANLFANYLNNFQLFRDGIFNQVFWSFQGAVLDQYILVYSAILRALLSLLLLILIILNKKEKIQVLLICLIFLFFELPFVYMSIFSDFHFISLFLLYEFLFSVILTVIFLVYFKKCRNCARNLFFKSFIILSSIFIFLYIAYLGFTVSAKIGVDRDKVIDLMKSQIDTTDIIATQIMIKDAHYYTLTKKTLNAYSDIFSKMDLVYMMAQRDNNTSFQWDSEMLSKTVVLLTYKQIHSVSTKDDPDDFWEAFHEKYNSNFSSYTKPIFSISGDYAIMEYSYYCGSTCGWGIILVLKKIDNKWIIIKKDNTWIS